MKDKFKQHRPVRIPLFYIIYSAFVILFIFLIVFFSAFLRNILSQYESVQPKYAAQEIFDHYFASFNYRDMREHYDIDAFLVESGYENEEEYYRAADELFDSGKISYYRSSSGIGQTMEYSVVINKMRVASFTLKLGTRTTEHGFRYYELDTIQVFNPFRLEFVTNNETKPPVYYYTYRITAPITHTVNIDGRILDEEDRVGEITYITDAMASAKSDFKGIEMVTYEVIYETPPNVTATDMNGHTVTPSYSPENEHYTFPITFNEEVEREFGPLAIEIAEKLGIYTQAGAKFNSVSTYYDPASPLYNQVKQIEASHWMVFEFESCEFQNQKISEAYRYSDTEVSIRVSMLQIMHRTGLIDSTDLIDCTFCFHLVDDQWLLYESFNN